MRRRLRPLPGRQRGAALLLLALLGLIVGLGLLFSFVPGSGRTERNALSSEALAQARAALIGYALTYRDTHPSETYGYLPCPDTNNDGAADAPCGGTDESTVGRLPWKTLGLPALRDGSGECLWYAVSGSAKNNPKTSSYNWDTPGQFILQDAAGNALTGAGAHERPQAIIFAPGTAISSQARGGADGSECGGGTAVAGNYLEGLAPLGTGATTVALATADSVRNATNNDQAVWITSADIFGPISKRSDFVADINGMLNDIAAYLNALSPAALPAASASNKGVGTSALAGSLVSLYQATNPAPAKASLFANWQDNLLYAKPGSTLTVNGETGCNAVLIFGGARSGSQTRATQSERDSAGNYLEAPLAALFPAAGSYSGNTDFASGTPAADLVRCIKGLIPPAVQASFAGDFGAFATAGAAGAATADAGTQTLTLQDASGTNGGCFWYGNKLPLAGRTLRAYYGFQFANPDPAGGQDLGNGFTLQLTRGDLGIPAGCGSETDNGVLPPLSADGGTWGSFSFIVETDIRRDVSRADPVGNHTAIMKNGSVNHAGFGSSASSACNGSSNLCQHSPANTFEESPTPLAHRQRLEITTGCNAGCGNCNPASHVAPNTYARVSVWVDCTNCSDVAVNLDRSTQPPTVQICTLLDTSMNEVYAGFTGGFRSGAAQNSVTVRDFVIRSE